MIFKLLLFFVAFYKKRRKCFRSNFRFVTSSELIFYRSVLLWKALRLVLRVQQARYKKIDGRRDKNVVSATTFQRRAVFLTPNQILITFHFHGLQESVTCHWNLPREKSTPQEKMANIIINSYYNAEKLGLECTGTHETWE